MTTDFPIFTVVPGLVTCATGPAAVVFDEVVVVAPEVAALVALESTDDEGSDDALLEPEALSDDEAPPDDEGLLDERAPPDDALSDDEAPPDFEALPPERASDVMTGAEADTTVDGTADAATLLAVVPGDPRAALSLLLQALDPMASAATPHNAHRRPGPADHMLTRVPCCRRPAGRPGQHGP